MYQQGDIKGVNKLLDAGRIQGTDGFWYSFLFKDVRDMDGYSVRYSTEVLHRQVKFLALLDWAYQVVLLPRESGISRWFRLWIPFYRR